MYNTAESIKHQHICLKIQLRVEEKDISYNKHSLNANKQFDIWLPNMKQYLFS